MDQNIPLPDWLPNASLEPTPAPKRLLTLNSLPLTRKCWPNRSTNSIDRTRQPKPPTWLAGGYTNTKLQITPSQDDIHYMTQDSVKAKFTWEEYAEKLRRSKAYQPDSATNLNPLVQLLSFSVASTNHKEPTTATTTTAQAASDSSNSGSRQQMENQSQSLNLMRNLTANRFNLRFWQRSSSGEKTTDNNNAKDNTDKPPKTGTEMDEQQKVGEKT